MKLKLLVGCLVVFHLAVQAQDVSDLLRLQANYNASVQRAVRASTQTYLLELGRLREAYLASNRAPEAQRVEEEIKIVTAKIAEMDKATPVPQIAAATPAARPPVESRLASPASTSIANRTLVSDARVKIPANSPDGAPLGPLRKGDVVVLQYREGKWKAFGSIATEIPDSVALERGHEDESRLVIAVASNKGTPGAVVAMVTPLTSKTPFMFPVPEDRSDLVLRINKNSDNKGNPGFVVYSVKVAR